MRFYQLAFTCYVYDSMTAFSMTYQELLEKTDYEIDLSDSEHRNHLIKWLNKWGCRQFSKDYHQMASKNLLKWYKKGYYKSIPEDKKIWEFNKSELKKVVKVYDSLAKTVASLKKRNDNEHSTSIGPTGASKILFALRPESMIPWDEAIRISFNHNGDGTSYVDYLKQAINDIKELEASSKKIGIELFALPYAIGRRGATVAQLVGEYYWVTGTRKCLPPDPEIIRCWAEEACGLNDPVELIEADAVLTIDAFVGGYMGTSYDVTIDFKKLQADYSVLGDGYELEGKNIINLSQTEILSFTQSLNELEVTKWKNRYETYGVCDGTNWSLHIQMKNDKEYSCSGSNAFPNEWNLFCKSVEKLTGKSFS